MSYNRLILGALAALGTRHSVRASSVEYTLTDELNYKNFFDNFDLYSGPDPTNGFVQYQNRTSAVEQQLIGFYEDTQTVFMGVDSTTKDPKGRASVRAVGTKTWNQGLLIADIAHMPESVCGSWPAFWMLGVGANGSAVWPQAGEIDILEGVNDQTSNAVTLHTSAGCAVENATLPAMGEASTSSANTAFTGIMSTDDCDVNAPNQPKNTGCSIQAQPLTHPHGLPTYGSDFNKAGGGIYAMEWTSSAITVWFLPRNSSAYAALTSGETNATTASAVAARAAAAPSPSSSASGSSWSSGFNYPTNSNSTSPANSTTPSDNGNGNNGTYSNTNSTSPLPSSSPNTNSTSPLPSSSPNTLTTASFPPPIAKFQGPNCAFDARFSHLKLVFNTAFCGDWAGKVWDDSCKAKTGVSTCEAYVQNNPGAFADSYWEVRGVRWYEQKNGTATATATAKRGAQAGTAKGKVVLPRRSVGAARGLHARGRLYAW